ncbi:MAG: GNAT family N-acetyltransferase, partial [Bacteroidales bacterium]|nr:GNAT family N-acetyltransferase [Bacteroidales bacterium]
SAVAAWKPLQMVATQRWGQPIRLPNNNTLKFEEISARQDDARRLGSRIGRGPTKWGGSPASLALRISKETLKQVQGDDLVVQGDDLGGQGDVFFVYLSCMSMKIERVTAGDGCAQLEGLLEELTGCAGQQPDLGAVLANPAVRMYVGREQDGRIVACGCLGVMDTLSGRKGHIEDIVVSGDCRGKGYGRQIVEFLIQEAKSLGPMELFLTSRPSRVAANALYQSLGFEKKETNCYKMNITI